MINLVRAVPGKKVLGGTELEKGVPPTQFYLFLPPNQHNLNVSKTHHHLIFITIYTPTNRI